MNSYVIDNCHFIIFIICPHLGRGQNGATKDAFKFLKIEIRIQEFLWGEKKGGNNFL